MTIDEFIDESISRGQSDGLASLDADGRLVFLISEAEVYCDMQGIDSLFDHYSAVEHEECAQAFAEIGASEIADSLHRIAGGLPAFSDMNLDHANRLITRRVGYEYESICAALRRSRSFDG